MGSDDRCLVSERDAPAVTVHPAEPAVLTALLAEAGLPSPDADAKTWVARDAAGRVVGGAAFVPVGREVLLRSCVVHPERRRSGVGALLVEATLRHARAAGATRAYLATESAAPFFATLGFVALAALPEPVAARLPHSCASATAMARTL